MNVKNTAGALSWIASTLRRLGIRFQIGGGLAAHAYGATRELYDIDLTIPEECFDQLIPSVHLYLISPPAWYTDENMKLLLMTLNYEGQEIDISGAYQTQVYDRISGQWQPSPEDLSNPEMMILYGIEVPVMPRTDLIAWKKKLGRPEDVSDIQEVEKETT